MSNYLWLVDDVEAQMNLHLDLSNLTRDYYMSPESFCQFKIDFVEHSLFLRTYEEKQQWLLAERLNLNVYGQKITITSYEEVN